ncbi:hypothetical protein C5B97_03025 [Pseudoclavibacter sp. RFBB5]|nr:hypothetical protein C5B97_03025 [Pseudoclavibacter sp. RFBB5]
MELGLLAVQPVELPLVVGERGDQQGAAWAGRAVFGVLAGPVDDGGFDAKSCREAVAHLTGPDGTGGHPLPRSIVACPVDDGEFDAEASLEAVTDLTRRRGTTERRCLRCLGVDGFVLHACIVSRTTDILRFGRHFLAIGATFSAGKGGQASRPITRRTPFTGVSLGRGRQWTAASAPRPREVSIHPRGPSTHPPEHSIHSRAPASVVA